MRPAALLALTLLACTRAAPTTATLAAASPPSAAPTEARDGARRCLPIVSGCGCAYACALTMHALDGGVHEVTHDLQDSRLDRATVERWCFDDAGRGGPEGHRAAAQRTCVEVFFDGTPCGGECVPRTDLLRCALVAGRCAAAR